ncbi:MAG: PA14 domain-containing protein [Patescibacteria group bacterium]
MPSNQKNPKRHFKKSIFGVFIFVAFFVQLFLLAPKPANAIFGVGDVTFSTVIGDIPAKLWNAVTSAVKKSGDIAYKNALKTFTQQLAYDAAVKIASGAAGQQPLFNTKPFSKSITDAANAAVGDYLDQITTAAWGKSLCDIDPKLKISIQASINVDLGYAGPPRQAKCTLSSITSRLGKKSLNDFYEVDAKLGFAIKGVDPAQLSQALLKGFPEMFGEDQAEISQYLSVYRGAMTEKEKAEKAEEAKQAKDFNNLVSAITGDTKTPAAQVEAVAEVALTETTTPEKVTTGSIIADMIGVFSNTLVKKYMEFILVKGLNPNADSTGSVQGKFGRTSGIAAAEAKFASFNQPSLGAGGSVDILNTLSTCPTDFAEPENCAIDPSFRTAVEQQLRLEEAIESGYINGDKPFGYGDGGAQLNYQEGYPYRSLVLLRRYRVIPVSWELAASYVREFGGGTKTLNELIREYDDPASQYYQLIDPDWVLKAPATMCVNSGYNETFLFDEYIDEDGINETPKIRQIQRNTSCVDDQSCIVEDGNGNCQQYGYCTKEDPIWRFNGESCPDYYNTCTTYTNRQGQPASYLAKTLDFNGCSADNVGCQWYCSEYNTTDERWECYYNDDGAAGTEDYGYWNYDPNSPGGGIAEPALASSWLSHLNANAESCTAGADGCSEFVRTDHGSNLISNASFEYYTGTPDDGNADIFTNSWSAVNGAVTEADTITSLGVSPYSDVTVMNLHSAAVPGPYIIYGIDAGSPVRNRIFTYSFYAMRDPDLINPACTDTARLELLQAVGPALASTTIDNLNDQWQRYQVTYAHPDSFNPAVSYLLLNIVPDTGCNIIIDAAKIEEAESAGQYENYGAINRVYLTGERESCNPDDVGCQNYTPLAGGSVIPGQVRPQDQCDSADVGCKAFEEVKLTNVVPRPDNIERSGMYCYGGANQGNACLVAGDCPAGYCLPAISFVPDTGAQCSAAYVGCEEFTNLDEVSAGGEGKEYYSFLKQCVTPADTDIASYYAWEGDAVAGYQLRAFRLKRSDVGGAFPAPCTHLEVGPTLPLDCEDSLNTVDDCTSEYGINPDCTQFFDSNLNIFYRYKTQTISVTEDCHPERNSIDNLTYYGSPSESRSCPAQFAGCREYLGNAGYNYRQVNYDDFEDGTNQGWSAGVVSPESVMLNGHSLNIASPNPVNKEPLDETLENKKTYMLSFWAKGTSVAPTIRFNHALNNNGYFADADPATFPASVVLTSDWNKYTLGPVNIDTNDYVGNVVPDGLVIEGLAGVNDYFDNIELIETSSSQYLIRGSFRTCYGSENCEAYSDWENVTHNLKSFTKLCSEDTVGCEALIDTQNNSNPFTQVYGSGVLSAETIPIDQVVTLINDPDKYCAAEDKGCKKLGKPIIDANNNLVSYEDTYLKDNPEDYDDIWCGQTEVGCEEYGFSDSGGKTFFKQPNGRTCEYKQLLGTYEFNWYVVGTEEVCDQTPTPPNPAIPAFVCTEGALGGPPAGTICDPENPVACTGSSTCIPWVGLCDSKANGCTAYSDPMDPVGCQPNCPFENGAFYDENCVETPGGLPGCATYYNIKSTVDSTSCNGVVNEEKGCKLFSDTQQSLNYSADLSPDGIKNYCDLTDPSTYGNECDVDADCGTGICFPNPEFGAPVLGRDGTCVGGTNPGDPCTNAADCLDAGVCDPYAITAESPSLDSNTVLKVKRDRVCEEWLYCKTSFEVDDETDTDGDGKTKEDVCFEIGLCDEAGSNGSCASTIDTAPVNVTGDTPAYPLDEFQNLSGFVSAGLHYGCRTDHSVACTVATEATACAGYGDECDIIEGYYPYSEMYEVGLGGAVTKDLVRFGNFESDALSQFMVCSSDMGNKDSSCIINEHCIPDEDSPTDPDCLDVNDEQTWTTLYPNIGMDSAISVVEGDTIKDGNAALDENNYLLYTAGSLGVCDSDSTNEGTLCTLAGTECTGGGLCSFTGLGVKTSLGTNILNKAEYIASLDFRFINMPEAGQEQISISLAQIDSFTGNIVGENILGYFDGSTGWTEQILKPVVVTGIPDENAETFLLIRSMSGNVPFAIDNVSMKPALTVKASESAGIRGDYYTLIYDNSGIPGLSYSYSGTTTYTGTDLQINEYEYCVHGDYAYLPPLCTVHNVPTGQRWSTPNETTTWNGGILIDSSGFHTVFVNINDGFRLYVDDMVTPIFDQYGGGVATQGYMFSGYFTAGWHPIKLEWINNGDDGGVQLGSVAGTYTNNDCNGTILPNFCQRYFDGVDQGPIGADIADGARDFPIPLNYIIGPSHLTTQLDRVFGTYLGTHVSEYLDYDAASMGPHLIDVTGADEKIAVRWTGKLLVETAGNHQFQLQHDDGVRFFIDDLDTPIPASNVWSDGSGTVTFTVNGLDTGSHPIKIEYYQNEGNSSLSFLWQPPGAPGMTVVPTTNLSTTDGDQQYIKRSCRAYPREDSEVCQYTNSDLVQFNGWQGYCIETDPTNPNKCITWWPVDAISGESSVFGTVEPAGYQGRRPLYMCVESTGNYNETSTFNDLMVNGAQSSCPDDEEGDINMPVSEMLGQFYGYRHPIKTNWANIQAGADSDCDGGEDTACGMVENHAPCRVIGGGTSANLYGFCGCTGGATMSYLVVDALEQDKFYEWEIDRIEWTAQRSSHGDWPQGQTTWIANKANDWTVQGDESNWFKDKDASIECGSQNCFNFKVNFDGNQLLDSFRVHMVDGSQAWGGMWVTGTIYLRDVCKEVAKVVSSTDDSAWAQRTASASSYIIQDLLYSYSSDAAPFGAMVAGAGADPGESWGKDSSGLLPVLLEGLDSSPSPAVNNTRLGQSYSCSARCNNSPTTYCEVNADCPLGGLCDRTSCVPKVCFGGANDSVHRSVQYSCSSDADCQGTEDDRAVCVGVGLCSGDQTIECTTDTDCGTAGSCVGADAKLKGDGPVNTGNAWALERLQRIFANVYGSWRWDDATGSYVDVPDFGGSWRQVWNDKFDNMVLCNLNGTGPRPIWPGPETDYCAILPKVSNILVNGTTGDVVMNGGGSVTLSFTSFVDAEQEELKNIIVDWGDGSTPTSIVWNGAPKSDPSQPHLFSHTYDDVVGPGAGEYQIEIMLKDNWGFCNNAVLPPGPNYRQCDINGLFPYHEYTEYDGIIRVYPS